MWYRIFPAVVVLAGAAWTEFTIDDTGSALTVKENGQPVLVYNYGMVSPPKAVDPDYARSCYIHPLYGLDGEVMTQDFPVDHRHHRGVFWAWPGATIGGEPADIWLVKSGIKQYLEEWTRKEVAGANVEIGVKNVWRYKDAASEPRVRETILFTVHPAQDNRRAIDFDLTFTNLTQKVIVIGGAETDNKGYGGFCFRPDAQRKPFTFTAPNGVLAEDTLELAQPWVDVTFPTEKGGEKQSGAAIFQHPGNPREYPYPGWITRAYGFLGCSWPHTRPFELPAGDSFRLRYRLLLHRGAADDADIAGQFDAYFKACKSEGDAQGK